MDNYVPIEVLMDKAMADEISAKGLAEIALRRTDAKFRAMVKCPVAGGLVSNNDLIGQVTSTALQLKKNNANIIEVRGMIRGLEGGIRKNEIQLNQLTSLAKTMASQVDGIYAASNVIQNLSYLNVGLSLANMAVNIVGFSMIRRKINELNIEIQSLALKVDQIINLEKNSKISICQKLIMRFNSMLAKIQDGDYINLDSLDQLIMEMRAFINEMIMNMYDRALDTELILKMVFTLMPAYTLLLRELIFRYYYKKGKLPPNYEIYLSIYDILTSNQIRTWMEDYYFLEQGNSGLEVLDILNAQILLVINSRVTIEDEVDLLHNCENKKEYIKLDHIFDASARSLLENSITKISEESEIDEKECRKILLGEIE